MTIAAILAQAVAQLAHCSDSPRLDAELLLCAVLHCERPQLFCDLQQTMSAAHCQLYQTYLARRQQGEPIAYILGEKEFWSLSLTVTNATLVPRPETELLVEQLLRLLPHAASLQIADLGTGSGAIALALAATCPAWQLLATDYSYAAVAIAKQNAVRLQLSNVQFAVMDWTQALTAQRFAAIVSNPPYLSQQEYEAAGLQLQHEPSSALWAEQHGMAAITLIATQAQVCLQAGGWLLLEHGYTQQAAVQKLLSDLQYDEITGFTDYQQLPRVVIGRKRG